MKDPTDSKTAELIPLRRKRGRPPSGESKTPAERKREQRERDRARLAGSEQDGKPVTVTGLTEAIGRYAAQGNAQMVEMLAGELVARIREQEANKP